MRVTRMCPLSGEKSQQQRGYSELFHSSDNFINEYFCTNISNRLNWLSGWTRVFIRHQAQPTTALHVKSLSGSRSLCLSDENQPMPTGLFG